MPPRPARNRPPAALHGNDDPPVDRIPAIGREGAGGKPMPIMRNTGHGTPLSDGAPLIVASRDEARPGSPHPSREPPAPRGEIPSRSGDPHGLPMNVRGDGPGDVTGRATGWHAYGGRGVPDPRHLTHLTNRAEPGRTC